MNTDCDHLRCQGYNSCRDAWWLRQRLGYRSDRDQGADPLADLATDNSDGWPPEDAEAP